MGRRELAVGVDGAVELDQGLVDATLVPQDLAPAVMGLGALGMDAQGLVQPGERLLDAPTVRGLHCLVQTVPVAILVLSHGSCVARRCLPGMTGRPPYRSRALRGLIREGRVA
jgi:hypothetical protein